MFNDKLGEYACGVHSTKGKKTGSQHPAYTTAPLNMNINVASSGTSPAETILSPNASPHVTFTVETSAQLHHEVTECEKNFVQR
jgi:hypothetical protein